MRDRHIYLIDFNEYQENSKAYGGMTDSKLGVIYQGEDWILKFPKSAKGMRKTEISYTTSPLSEYIGSHIHQILGYPIHEARLGTKNNKLVIACKGFTDLHVRLQEFRRIKSYYSEELEVILEDTITDSNSVGNTNLHAVKTHLNYSSLLYMIDEMSERF